MKKAELLQMGILAGFTVTEILKSPPGLIYDSFSLYAKRQGYHSPELDEYGSEDED